MNGKKDWDLPDLDEESESVDNKSDSGSNRVKDNKDSDA